MGKNIIIIPTFNEIENISLIITELMDLYPDVHILVVDDSSPDGTGKAVLELKNQFSNRLFLLERKEKSGLGTAYIAGFEWALKEDYEHFIEMDADFSHFPKHVKRLIDEIEKGVDVVVGSRYIDGGKIKNWPFGRRFISYGGALYARLITGVKVKDLTAGFVCYNRSTLESIDLRKISSVGYSFQIEMKYAAYRLGKTIAEVPITFIDRVRGTSKMDSSIIREAAIGVIRMRLQEKNFYRKST